MVEAFFLSLQCLPSKACLETAIYPIFTERSGGVAAIVCDATENIVRQGYCYTCLARGGGDSVGSLSVI